MRECLEQMGGVTRKEFLIQRLTVWKGVKKLGNCNVFDTFPRRFTEKIAQITIIIQSEKKLWKACMVMLISWSLTWSPYALLFLLAISGQQNLLSHHSVMAAGWLTYIVHFQTFPNISKHFQILLPVGSWKAKFNFFRFSIKRKLN